MALDSFYTCRSSASRHRSSNKIIMSNLLMNLRDALDVFLLILAVLVPVSTLIVKKILITRLSVLQDNEAFTKITG